LQTVLYNTKGKGFLTKGEPYSPYGSRYKIAADKVQLDMYKLILSGKKDAVRAAQSAANAAVKTALGLGTALISDKEGNLDIDRLPEDYRERGAEIWDRVYQEKLKQYLLLYGKDSAGGVGTATQTEAATQTGAGTMDPAEEAAGELIQKLLNR
jgi:hypothetical protein